MVNVPEKYVVLESIQRKPCQVQGIFDTRQDAVNFLVAYLDEYGYDKNPLYNFLSTQNVFTDSKTNISYIIRGGPYYSRPKR